MTITPAPSWTRNGLPVRRGYVYRGTGRDALTGGMLPRRVEDDIAAAEGDGYARPLTASDTPADSRKAADADREKKRRYAAKAAAS